MSRRLLVLFSLAVTAFAANVKLYMTDGTFQIVREYKVEGDRVRFYTTERSEWEEVPKQLVDLKRTESEAKERQEELAKEARIDAVEEKAAKELEAEVMRIPQNPGVYWVVGDKALSLKPAESTVHTDKGRSILKVLAPIPVVSGKATVEIPGAHSEHIFTNPNQEFYIQLSQTERFGIVRVRPKGGVRIVEDVTVVPVSKETVEERDSIPIFQKELASGGLYKIWPREPFSAGEYAVVEFTEGKMNMQIWDFAVKPDTTKK